MHFPAIATSFVGEAHYELLGVDDKPVSAKVASMIMSFDHCLVNGVGAASFIGAVHERIATIAPAGAELPESIIRIRKVA